MRLVLRFSMMLVVAGLAWSQALTDAAGVIAGSSVGVGAGKQVGQGIAAALNGANATTAKVAKTEKVASAEKPAAVSPAGAATVSAFGSGFRPVGALGCGDLA